MSEVLAFSEKQPRLQLAWDPTSINNLMQCPRYYQLTNLEGWRGSAVDLEFGILCATAWEHYQKARIRGDSKDAATLEALRNVTERSWDYEKNKPWGGRYANMWRCEGTEPYKNAKGNRAVCPYHHKKPGAAGEWMWFPEPAPETCGECGSAVIRDRHYIPANEKKNRTTVIRTVLWYCLEQPEALEDGLHPYVFPNGKPAVELPYRIPLPWRSDLGEQYILCGHLDYLGEFATELFVVDNKTTTKPLNQKLWDSYSPSTQFDTYDLVGTLLFPDLDIKGVMIDAAQVQTGGSQYMRHPYYKTEGQRQEHLETVHYWIEQAEMLATKYADKDYPMNKRSCWICQFKGICDKDPKERGRWLRADFVKGEPWNPLLER